MSEMVMSIENKLPRSAYVRNLIDIGWLAINNGAKIFDGRSLKHLLTSSDDRTKGFTCKFYFLMEPSPIYRIQNREYPYLVLERNGPARPGLFGGSFPRSDVRIIIKDDGLTHLEVDKCPSAYDILDQLHQLQRPEETYEYVSPNGLVRRRQYTYDSDSYISISSEMNGWCPSGLALLEALTGKALHEFQNPQNHRGSIIQET